MSESISEALSREKSRALAQDVLTRIKAAIPGVRAVVAVRSGSSASVRFSRNEVLDVSGSEQLGIDVRLETKGRIGWVITNRRDAEGLADLIDRARETEHNHGDNQSMVFAEPKPFSDPPIHFEATLEAAAPALQSDLVRRAIELAAKAQVVATGAVSTSTRTLTLMNTLGLDAYTRSTYGEFSVNARTDSGKGSGWAWGGAEDFARIDVSRITERAIDLAKRSDAPVAVEPGRYTVILEPEALAQLLDGPVFKTGTRFLGARAAAEGQSVFSRFEGGRRAGSKLGLQMADQRVQLYSDPMDTHLPFSPLDSQSFENRGWIMPRTVWIEKGVLRNLAYDASYARAQNRPIIVNPQRGTLAVSGSTQTLDEMIATTKRGIWVHRFSDAAVVSPLTLLLTGVTRDGTFLIENGKVTKAIKNLRFSESPFFILNKIEAAGPIVRGNDDVACPRLKVRDFEFTSLSDAI